MALGRARQLALKLFREQARDLARVLANVDALSARTLAAETAIVVLGEEDDEPADEDQDDGGASLLPAAHAVREVGRCHGAGRDRDGGSRSGRLLHRVDVEALAGDRPWVRGRDAGAEEERVDRAGRVALAVAEVLLPRADDDGLRAVDRDADAVAANQAARFLKIYEEYKKAPEVTRRRMFLETMERVMEGTDKIILDSKPGGQGVVPFLPLDQLQKKKDGAN